MKNLKFFFGYAGVMVLLAVFLTNTALCAEKPIKWRLQGIHAQGSPIFTTVEETCNLIKEMSNGRLEITPYSSGQIVSAGEVVGALGRGLFELTECYGGYFAGVVGDVANIESGPLGVPMGPEDFEALYYDLGWLEIIKEAYAKKGFHFIGVGYDVADFIFSVKEPIDTVAKIEGKKFRSAGSTAKSLSAAGAKVVFLPWEECYTSAQTGTIDALEWGNLSLMYQHGFHEVAKYWTMPGLGKVHCAPNYVANMEAWNKLPNDLKEIVETAFRRSSLKQYARLKHSDTVALEKAKKAGVQVVTWSEKEQRQWGNVCRTVWDDLAKSGPQEAKMIQIFKDYIKQVGYVE